MAVLPENIVIDTAPVTKRERRTARVILYLTPSLDKEWRGFCDKYRLSVNEASNLAIETYLKAANEAEAKRA